MLTAAYSTPASDWTRAIDAALAEWSRHIVGEAHLRIEIAFDDQMPHLAKAGPLGWKLAGDLADAGTVFVSSAAAALFGAGNATTDIRITINPEWPWHFGANETTPGNAYSAVAVMVHELGHGLFMTKLDGFETPFTLWADDQPNALLHGAHFAERGPLMHDTLYWGPGNVLTALDLEAASGSGMPTHGDDMISIPIGATRVDAGAGIDTAIWLGKLNGLTAELVNVETLHLAGADPLTAAQADLYRLYEAAFDRAPDLAGFEWWDGIGIRTAAGGFVCSDEFASRYDYTDHADLVTAFYANILDREPDAAGLAYWLDRDDLGAADLLTAFALADENTIGVPTFTL